MKKKLLLFVFVLAGMAVKAQSTARAELSVYPNPAAEYISVQDKHDAVGEIAIFSIVGRRVKEFEYTKGDQQYYISDLPKGMYLVQLIDKNKRILTTQKLEKR
ncbi:MAG TPA: T9SS type A sorting domain-containing protein [Saprospiraceae bacterium]|nr:T9SS type A sorting domain-containing protein [Saprospiraceae bacterium]HPI08913.1 T9SS type A sorting domain-containing protein [Saprospiraceae bacterium]